MIVSMHVASGAAAGAALGSRAAAGVVGPLLHLACDGIPHHDISSRRFEIVSGAALLGLLAVTRGPLDPAVIGGIASSAPDLEHVIRLPRPGGRKLFPSHRVPEWHRIGGLPTWAQLLMAGTLVGLVLPLPGSGARSARR